MNQTNLTMMSELISAGELMDSNLREYLFKSGNLPRPIVSSPRSRRSNGDDAALPDNMPGYLKNTGSLATRKTMTLKMSHAVHGSKRDKSAAGQVGGGVCCHAIRLAVDVLSAITHK